MECYDALSCEEKFEADFDLSWRDEAYLLDYNPRIPRPLAFRPPFPRRESGLNVYRETLESEIPF